MFLDVELHFPSQATAMTTAATISVGNSTQLSTEGLGSFSGVQASSLVLRSGVARGPRCSRMEAAVIWWVQGLPSWDVCFRRPPVTHHRQPSIATVFASRKARRGLGLRRNHGGRRYATVCATNGWFLVKPDVYAIYSRNYSHILTC